MPEGDTIFRAAETLNRALAGKTVTEFETVLPRLARIDEQRPLLGRVIERVAAAGKHLIIGFSGDLHLRTHMRMNGSWHIYRPGERWQRRRSDMRIVIATEDFVAVAFNVPVAEFLSGRQLVRNEDLRHLGPDLLAAAFDQEEAFRRMRARDDVEIANVLLNQRVLAGIGNVFKSEVLFVSGVSPFATVGQIDDEGLRKIVTVSRDLMRLNVLPGTRGRETTRRMQPSEKLWVYGRGGDPCRRCGTPIEYRKQGPDARGTYWCPSCQPAF